MDIDRINDRIDALNELRRNLIEVQEEAQHLGVEPEMGAIMQELGTLEGMAALYNDADRETLRRAMERMAL
jgi:hypothetical protein